MTHDLFNMIQSATNIPRDRMTLMVPGWKLKKFSEENAPLKSLTNAAEAVKGTLMGTPSGEEFVKKEVAENSSGNKRTAIEKKIEHGYTNLGNTCYMNSVIAMLENCNDFVRYIVSSSPATTLHASWQQLWARKQRNSPEDPRVLFSTLCSTYPAFGQRSSNNPMVNQQQDADECLTVMFNNLASEPTWKSLFEVNLKQTVRAADESVNTAETVTTESSLKLNCYPGTITNPVSHLLAGISVGLNETVECNGAVNQRVSRLTKSLPKYLIVHMVRFEWKKANDLARTKACRAKVLKRIEYPTILDLYQFCDEDLQEVLSIGRLTEEDEGRPEENQESRKSEQEASSGPQGNEKEEFVADGTYKLRAVVTHRGRTVEEGHYICWNWHEDTQSWIKLDDDKSSEIHKNGVDLQGGLADGHVPYIILYERHGEFIA